jgi:hypothetical protein
VHDPLEVMTSAEEASGTKNLKKKKYLSYFFEKNEQTST